MWQRRFTRLGVAAGLGVLLTAVLIALAGAYAEEPIPFRDPMTGAKDQDVQVSTIHLDLTYVLAIAAGFSIDDSRTLAIWDQLVDSSLITTTDAIYSNCIGTSPPKITVERCEHPRDGDALFWPAWDNPEWDRLPTQGPGTSCVTSRYGPFEGFFHFPHRSVPDDSAHDGSDPAHYGPEMAALHDWGWGFAQELKGYQGYVWGPPLSPSHPAGMSIGSGFFGNTCFYTESMIIDTGMTPGSLEAFATYLHSLADSYSHEQCQKRTDGDDLGWAWPTHTVPLWPVPEARRIYECNYIPDPDRQSIGDSHHGREFGSEPEWANDLQRTDEAIRAVYAELQARSADKEGVYPPLDLDAPLGGRFYKQTLDEALYTFVHEWNFNQPEARRAYLKQLAEAILALREPADD